MTLINPRPNPYVGPRAFETGETLYGRDRELQDLLDLLIAERIVLLYSPSGAGKSSLIHAGLIPRLREIGFHVLPVIRVNQEPPQDLKGRPNPADQEPASQPLDSTSINRYLFSTLLSLEEGLSPEQQMEGSRLAKIRNVIGIQPAGQEPADQAGRAQGQQLLTDRRQCTPALSQEESSQDPIGRLPAGGLAGEDGQSSVRKVNLAG